MTLEAPCSNRAFMGCCCDGCWSMHVGILIHLFLSISPARPFGNEQFKKVTVNTMSGRA